ncbi:glycoside hydrolase family 172 protein [Aeoliella mucimassa]|uniref:DUF2961 domain-containing protein n=1 Tax=Aeoliella mucimassa TaxID=2527972 RepID=A0A518AW10_9BACT|nr:glycoside hydrolase family 172 protein [Aeoliella mucimassa]QDU58902.1 hypothetical protein Pan181_51430 [Aeoliella mucimassa]
MRTEWRWCLALLLLVGGSSLATAEPVTLESLLGEMTNRDTLARLPEPSYTCSQASSYDRNTVEPDDHNSWMANADRSQWVRIEEREVDGKLRKEFVMMDQEGPGAIVRLWATWHGPQGKPFSNGTLRVYLDGSDTPAIEGPIQQVIDQGLLAGAPLSQGVSPETDYRRRGHNLYLPIPYAKHCKVTYSTDVLMDIGARQGEALYYQINYRTYAPETEVESFSMEKLAEAKPAVRKAQDVLLEEFAPQANSSAESQATLAAGKSIEGEFTGSQAIRELSLKLEADDLPQALRSTVLKIEFDGEPCVWCPVGEFFGIGYQPSEYRSYNTQMNSDGTLVCHWVMPFKKSANFSLKNLGTQPVQVAFQAKASSWQWDDRSMHFHSVWHELYKVDTWVGADRPGDAAYDVNYATIEGQGVYAGDTLTVFNGAAAWWGEGDEKIYVDGETFPSHIGTGTEDYYGYAWCMPTKFAAPFHAQPTGDGNVAGGFSVNSRYRALDAIPFTKSIKFDMELWHWASTKVNYAPTVFFYARPGATCNIQPDAEAAAREIMRSRAQLGTLFAIEGALEGENLKVASKTAGVTTQQRSGTWRWSNEAQLWWREAAEGDELVVEFPVEQAGKYRVEFGYTKAPDYAKVDLLVNDEKALSLNGYDTQVTTHQGELGTFDLLEGTNRLTVRITGHDAKAIQRGMFGLDYLKLDRVDR